jgi:hypothetical protein
VSRFGVLVEAKEIVGIVLVLQSTKRAMTGGRTPTWQHPWQQLCLQLPIPAYNSKPEPVETIAS